MKLLNKESIVTLKGTERKKEIDEGLKLARRIEALRETSAKEEANLAKFRTESLKKVKEEIDILVKEKNSIQVETTALYEERIRLQIPLDKEWHKVKEKQNELHAIESDVNEREETLKNKEKELVIEAQRLLVEKEKVKNDRREAEDNLEKSGDYLKSSKSLFSKAEVKVFEGNRYYEDRHKVILSLESDIAAHERDIENKSKLNDKRQKELDKRERFINDKYKTFERSIKRLKHG